MSSMAATTAVGAEEERAGGVNGREADGRQVRRTAVRPDPPFFDETHTRVKYEYEYSYRTAVRT